MGVLVNCDGTHGGPRCADPECWNDEPGRTLNEVIDLIDRAIIQTKEDSRG